MNKTSNFDGWKHIDWGIELDTLEFDLATIIAHNENNPLIKEIWTQWPIEMEGIIHLPLGYISKKGHKESKLSSEEINQLKNHWLEFAQFIWQSPSIELEENTFTVFGNHGTIFSFDANLLPELEVCFRSYSKKGKCRYRHYVHNAKEEELHGVKSGNFTEWREFDGNSDLLFYEGLHGAVVNDEVNLARYADLKIGVVPVINLEWIQKIHRDRDSRGYSTEAVTDTILRRMHAYVHCICPQFTETDINFQRVPVVDTSNPLVARWIPTADESLVVIRFKDPHGIDFPYLVSMIHDSWMSRANSIVIPGGKLDLAMQLILTPLVGRLVNQSKRVL